VAARVVQRLEGSDGLAKVARSTRRTDDLRAWCRSLLDVGDWKAALPAFEERPVSSPTRTTREGSCWTVPRSPRSSWVADDLPKWLEHAWRASPSMLRLRRWLGSAGSKAAIRKRTAEALEACPKPAARQRALLT